MKDELFGHARQAPQGPCDSIPAMNPPAPRPGPFRAWYAVILLLLAYTLSYVDRQILTLMVDPISRDLQLTDTQFSLLHGAAFALFYTFLGLPFGWMVDRYDRRALAGAGVLGWSVMTALCGLSRSYGSLFGARMGVGVGEATLSPAAYSMIADLFPKERLARAISIYSIGIAAGSGLALIFGGTLIESVNRAGEHAWPLFGVMRPWQTVFVILGLIGVPLAALVFLLREPARTGAGANEVASFRSVLRFVAAHPRLFTCFLLGFAVASALGQGILGWVPSHFVRNFGWSASEVGLRYGLCVLIGGSAGMVIGGRLTEWLQRKGRTDAPLRVAVVAIAVCAPLGIAAPLATRPALALALFGLLQFAFMMPWGVAGAALQLVAPNRMRGQLSAIYLFVISLIGLGIGPTLVALLSDRVFGGGAGVSHSLSLTAAILAPLATLLLLGSLPSYRAMVRSAAASGDAA